MIDEGEAAFSKIQEIEDFIMGLPSVFNNMATELKTSLRELRSTTEWLLTQPMNNRFSGAVNYLRFFARVLGGYYHLKAANAENDSNFRGKLANVYFTRLLPECQGLSVTIRKGSDDIFSLTNEELQR